MTEQYKQYTDSIQLLVSNNEMLLFARITSLQIHDNVLRILSKYCCFIFETMHSNQTSSNLTAIPHLGTMTTTGTVKPVN